MKNRGQIILYKNKIQVRLKNETVWLSQKQIADIFGVNVPAISKHINNVFKSKELVKKPTVSKMEIVRKEGERRFNNNALVALALLIAESNPKDKDVLIKLIINFLN